VDNNLIESIAELQKKYDRTESSAEKEKLYQEVLSKLEIAQKRIEELETENSKPKLPSRDEVETMSSMVDLISKLDETTIEKLNRFGRKS